MLPILSVLSPSSIILLTLARRIRARFALAQLRHRAQGCEIKRLRFMMFASFYMHRYAFAFMDVLQEIGLVLKGLQEGQFRWKRGFMLSLFLGLHFIFWRPFNKSSDQPFSDYVEVDAFFWCGRNIRLITTPTVRLQTSTDLNFRLFLNLPAAPGS